MQNRRKPEKGVEKVSRTTEAITLLELELKEAEARVKTLRVAVETVRQLAPAAMDKTVIVGGQVAAALSAIRQPAVEPETVPDPVPEPEPVSATAAVVEINGRSLDSYPGITGEEPPKRKRGHKSKQSKYPHVTPGKTRADGRRTWRAVVEINGRRRYFGTFLDDAEAEAAAAAYIEQIENNPDRPKPKHRKAKKAADLPPPAAHKWECNKCGRNYVKKPDACSCGCQVLVRINADSSGAWDMPKRTVNLMESADE